MTPSAEFYEEDKRHRKNNKYGYQKSKLTKTKKQENKKEKRHSKNQSSSNKSDEVESDRHIIADQDMNTKKSEVSIGQSSGSIRSRSSSRNSRA